MSETQTVPAGLQVQERHVISVSIPRTIWLTVAGIFITFIGGTWDLAWHYSIGRETFWTPAHILVQAGGILVALACAYTILTTSFGASPVRAASVRILRLYAPGGVFVALWGSVAMFASAPFDNWWHNAYGLDAKIYTPPHVLLATGYYAAQVGAMVWIASTMNRSRQAPRGWLPWLILFMGGIGVLQLSVFILNPTWFTHMHAAQCYLMVALFIPAALIAAGWASLHKWGCTIVGGIYTGISLGAEWLLPLFPAQPKLGPVYHNVTHLVPLRFPLLLIVGAFVADLLLQRLKHRPSWIKSLLIGPAFLLSYLAVQWPFANFLMSPASRHWIFGSAYFAYADHAGFLYNPYRFIVVEKTPVAFAVTMLVAFLASILTTLLWMCWGEWMLRVRR